MRVKIYFQRNKKNVMRKTALLCIIIISAVFTLKAQVRNDFCSLYVNTEKNPSIRIEAENLAVSKGLPYEIYICNTAYITAISTDNGRVVYSVITDFLNPYNGGRCAYYEDIIKSYDLSKARITYGSGTVDNSGETLSISRRRTAGKLILLPCSTTSRRSVFAFDYNTGDIVDTAFIPYSGPTILQTPRKALQLSKTRVIVADQVADVVQLFDTSGAYLQVFAPSGGLNNAILDNIRDMEFRANGNLLVTNQGTAGNSYNTVQQFDHNGVFLNTFANEYINSPYNLLFRTNDILLGNSSGTTNIGRYNINTGMYAGDFISSTLNFPQQMINIPGGKVGVCEFSGGLTGFRIYDSVGVLKDTFKVVTGLRGAFKLPGGNYLLSNSTGVYEIDDTTGALIRTLVSGLGFGCFSVFDPDMVTGYNGTQIETPDGYRLYENYPNPFNPSTVIKFSLPGAGKIKLTVYNALGREVQVLFNGIKQAGTHEITFDADNLPSGVYFYRLSAGNFTDTKKMVLVR